MVTLNVFVMIWEWIDTFLKKIHLDDLINNGLDKYFFNLHELFKILIVILLAIIIILGAIQLVKKFFKLAIVLTIILVVVYFVSAK